MLILGFQPNERIVSPEEAARIVLAMLRQRMTSTEGPSEDSEVDEGECN